MKSLIIFFTLIGSLSFFEAPTEKLNRVNSSLIEFNHPCGCVQAYFDCRKDYPGIQGFLFCAEQFELCDQGCPY